MTKWANCETLASFNSRSQAYLYTPGASSELLLYFCTTLTPSSELPPAAFTYRQLRMVSAAATYQRLKQ